MTFHHGPGRLRERLRLPFNPRVHARARSMPEHAVTDPMQVCLEQREPYRRFSPTHASSHGSAPGMQATRLG